MTMEWASGLLKALFATIVIEEFVALFWNERSLRLAWGVLAANVTTNPTINIMVKTLPDACFETDLRYYSLIIALEIGVWISETFFFWRLGCVKSLNRAALFSLALNATSYLSGYPLAKLGYWG